MTMLIKIQTTITPTKKGIRIHLQEKIIFWSNNIADTFRIISKKVSNTANLVILGSLMYTVKRNLKHFPELALPKWQAKRLNVYHLYQDSLKREIYEPNKEHIGFIIPIFHNFKFTSTSSCDTLLKAFLKSWNMIYDCTYCTCICEIELL